MTVTATSNVTWPSLREDTQRNLSEFGAGPGFTVYFTRKLFISDEYLRTRLQELTAANGGKKTDAIAALAAEVGLSERQIRRRLSPNRRSRPRLGYLYASVAWSRLKESTRQNLAEFGIGPGSLVYFAQKVPVDVEQLRRRFQQLLVEKGGKRTAAMISLAEESGYSVRHLRRLLNTKRSA